MKAVQFEHASQLTKLPALIMTSYVSPTVAELLRAKSINFVDAAGNISLRHGPLYIWVSGRRGEVPPRRSTRAFQTTGLRLVTLVLEQPEALAWTYRELAEASGVSLGSVGPALEDLRLGGHVKTRKDGAKLLVSRRALFDRWELAYNETLRPRLLRRTCRLAGHQTLDDLEARINAVGLRSTVRIGGELAAARMTDHLRPTRAVLHLSRGTPEQLMVKLKLLPDAAGPIEILLAATKLAGGDHGLASPFLVHAELMRVDHTDGRLRETAALLFERHLKARLTEPRG